MDCTLEVIIVGAGVVGLSAAIAMSKRGFSVGIIDLKSIDINNNTPSVRVYALNQASCKLMNELGINASALTKNAAPYRHMHVWDATNGAHIDFDARMAATDKLGIIIDDTTIKQLLIQKASDLGVLFFPESSVTHIECLNYGVNLHSSLKTWHAHLLIVADGANSKIRQLLGVKVTQWPYHHDALVATVQVEKPHNNTAYQVFNPNGPLAFLPLPHPYQCSIVWSTPESYTNTLMMLPEDDFASQLTQAFAHKLGECQLLSSRVSISLTMRHAQSYSGRAWLLMGDAAHTIHPLAGLGLNVGLNDLSTWLRLLNTDNNLVCLHKKLGAYQRERKHEVWKTILLMQSLKSIFANHTLPLNFLRGLGLSACNHTPMLKRALINYAANGQI